MSDENLNNINSEDKKVIKQNPLNLEVLSLNQLLKERSVEV